MDNQDQINAVERMQSYIEGHLHDPITLRQLANAAGYSPWHAARVFKALTGKSPFDYIRSLRLSRAAGRLRDGSARVVDVWPSISSSTPTRASRVPFPGSSECHREVTPGKSPPSGCSSPGISVKLPSPCKKEIR